MGAWRLFWIGQVGIALLRERGLLPHWISAEQLAPSAPRQEGHQMLLNWFRIHLRHVTSLIPELEMQLLASTLSLCSRHRQGLVLLATLGDLIILDWLIVSKITSGFVIIPGTDRSDYRDFSHHFRAHARAAITLVLLCALFAAIVWYF